MKHVKISLLAILFISFASVSYAEEGMWLFSNPPKKAIQEKYGFEINDDWLNHVQKSSVRFGGGGSASFVSSDGLVMTNHHVGFGSIQKLSTPEHDYIKDGFYAENKEDELKCPALELVVLQEIEDVTSKVNAAVKPGMTAEEAEKARRAVMNEIELKSQEETGLKSDVVTLYQGGVYHLYRYKKYDDVRLVFAPEQSIAFFGGDPDNFEYPRYDLDVSFFRVYEDGKPVKTPNFLKWSKNGAEDCELVFVSGHPGRTERGFTTDHVKFQRDVTLPKTLEKLRRRAVLLKTFGERSAENKRRVQDEVFGIDNSLKVRGGMFAGLQTPAFIEKKNNDEKEFISKINSTETNEAYKIIVQNLDKVKNIFDSSDLLEGASIFNSQSFGIARTLVRLSTELEKENSERLREFRESNLESLKQSLLSTAPIYEDVEIVKLADGLSLMIEKLGAENPLVDAILAGKSPKERATELINGTKVRDIAVRKELIENGKKSDLYSSDPMIQLAILVDEESRKIRTENDKIQEDLRQAYAKIADEKFKVNGTDDYPDATFTLRLSYGTVKGYKEDDGTEVPAMTKIGGTFEHAAEHDYKPPYNLPESWMKSKDKLDLEKPMNLVSTNDIIGGNSGSPLINKDAEVVGLIFDGNIHSLVSNYAYTDDKSRAVSVHSSAIMESLRKVYGADKLADELGK
ncbi:MAG: S46 family peptidase [Thermoguttaceae bacterium]